MFHNIAQQLPYAPVLGVEAELRAALRSNASVAEYELQVEGRAYRIRVKLKDEKQFSSLCKQIVNFTEYRNGFTCYQSIMGEESSAFEFLSADLKGLAFRCRIELMEKNFT